MLSKKIAVGSDHAGFSLKTVIMDYLSEKGCILLDKGAYNSDSVDYPDYASLVAKSVISGESDMGILICCTGIGMSISANRFDGIRAALCYDSFTAKMSRKHNNANILVMGAGMVGPALAKDMVDIWLCENFEGGRHQRRIDKIENINK